MVRTGNKFFYFCPVRYLGIDFGTKRIGVALSDAAGDFAYPHSVLKNDRHALTAIVRICTENDIGGVVFGESRDYAGKENEMMKLLHVFKAAFADATKRPTFFEPEFLTSAHAARDQGVGELLDASAAALILGSFLSRKQSS